MNSRVQLEVLHINQWRRHLVNAYEVKLCDSHLSALSVSLE